MLSGDAAAYKAAEEAAFKSNSGWAGYLISQMSPEEQALRKMFLSGTVDAQTLAAGQAAIRRKLAETAQWKNNLDRMSRAGATPQNMRSQLKEKK